LGPHEFCNVEIGARNRHKTYAGVSADLVTAAARVCATKIDNATASEEP
jgi:hypothetical protein